MSKFFKIPFAFQGDRKPVAEDTQPDGVVSYRQGFGFDYQLDYDQPNAKDIDREQMNQILYDITSAIGDAQRTGVATWSEAGKPYPKGAIVHYNKELYVSLNDANNNVPTGAGWSELYYTANTSVDKSGFLRASGSANALTESDRTSSLGTSTTLVATQKLVNDVNSKIKLNTASEAQNGWWKCGDTGLMIQWGEFTSGGVTNFPIAFSNSSVTVTLGTHDVHNSADNIFITNVTATGFSSEGRSSAGKQYNFSASYIAIGY